MSKLYITDIQFIKYIKFYSSTGTATGVSSICIACVGCAMGGSTAKGDAQCRFCGDGYEISVVSDWVSVSDSVPDACHHSPVSVLCHCPSKSTVQLQCFGVRDFMRSHVGHVCCSSSTYARHSGRPVVPWWVCSSVSHCCDLRYEGSRSAARSQFGIALAPQFLAFD